MDPWGSVGAARRASAYPGYRPVSARQYRFRRAMVLVAVLSLVALIAGCLGRSGPAPVPLHVAWVFSPASNTVTIRVTPQAGTAGQQVLAQSRLAVSENGNGHTERWSAAGGTVRVPVSAGGRTRLLVQLTGSQSLTRALTINTPRPPRIVASGASSGRWLVFTSAPLQAGPPQVLCGTDEVTLVSPSQLAVSESATACQALLQLTAQNGERAAVPVTIPALPKTKAHAVSVAKLYCFANPAGRAIYITIDDGWTPSNEVLALMHQTYLPITAFLIAEAADEDLSYWKDFVAAGGMIGDHTVSHPYLTKLTLAKATSQWGQARTALGRWLGQTPVIGRPPYGAFDHKVEVAAARGGLTALAGWSATMSGNRIQTWDGKPLSPGEIVILHWVPGLGRQLTVLLAAIRALHLNPTPLTLASFSGIAPQQRSLNGD
ncbi:MAG TPA: polysaccharide deacetylase family protein [Streptosporangiaceae bacterium]|nr:polysaccharide deacetylase family protein [Streptosporangiaceae bacterium]